MRSHPVLVAALGILTGAGLTACEEVGPDARGEVQTTALQRVADDRACIPYMNIASVRMNKGSEPDVAANRLIFVLNDGTRWANMVGACSTGDVSNPSMIFESAAREICANDAVYISDRAYQLNRLADRCTLGRFSRI